MRKLEFDNGLRILPLVVDLDKTLLRSDLPSEMFWSACSRDILFPLRLLLTLASEPGSIKKCISGASKIDLSKLPLDEKVITYIKAWREKGGRTILVTAGDQQTAEEITNHLQLFDEVYGNSSAVNLNSQDRAKFLADLYRDDGFAYLGHTRADLPVWQEASMVITANATVGLRNRVEELGLPTEHLKTFDASWVPYLKALRPHQWIKNLLVFLPMIAGHRLELHTLTVSLCAFLVFCLFASSVYLVNDTLDLQADRIHPRKSKRPIASGLLPITHAGLMAVSAAILGGLTSYAVAWQLLLVMVGYYVLSLSYCLFFKRHAVADICVLAGLYTLRIIAGAVATDIKLSGWLIAFSLFLFLSLAAVKRQAELIDMKKRCEFYTAGRGYRTDDLPIVGNIAMSAGYLSVLVLALYINSPDVVELYSRPTLLWGSCCVLLYWITHIIMVANRGEMNDDPIVYSINDFSSRLSFVIICGLVYAATFLDA